MYANAATDARRATANALIASAAVAANRRLPAAAAMYANAATDARRATANALIANAAVAAKRKQ